MVKDRRSHDQRRKAKVTARNRRHARPEPLAYHGRKYQADEWVPSVLQTELGVYEAIKQSRERLTNEQVRTAFIQLIEHLRRGQPGPLSEEEPEVVFATGKEVEFLIWNIRRHWLTLFETEGPV